MKIKWQRGIRFVETPFQDRIDTLEDGQIIKHPRKVGEPTVYNWRFQKIDGPPSILDTGTSVVMNFQDNNSIPEVSISSNQTDK